VRLFAGVAVPPLDVAVPDGVRRVPEAGRHVTVFFLGERVDVPALPPVRAGRLRTGAPAWFGSALALEVEDLDGVLGEVHAQGIAGWAPERRPFRPHVTIGRLPRAVRRPALPAAPAPVTWVVGELVLWRSAGGRYEPLARRPAKTTSSP
jgi:hypothetical protein